MDPHDALVQWFRNVVEVMDREARNHHDAAVQGRTETALEASATCTRRAAPATSIGALSCLDALADSDSSLVADFVSLAAGLPWKRSTRTGDDGNEVGLVELTECLDLGLLSAGVMLLSPGVGYPEHQHEPAEVYLNVTGSRAWRFGGSDHYVRVHEGEVLSNSSMDIHGVEPGDDVLLAVWVLIDR